MAGNQLGLMTCPLIIFWTVLIGGVVFDIIASLTQRLRCLGVVTHTIVLAFVDVKKQLIDVLTN